MESIFNKSLADPTEKPLRRSLSLIKIQALRPVASLKREPNTGAFPFSREVSEIPKNTFFYSTPLVAASWAKLFSV